jgi:signal transduction histidine kinase
MPSGEFDLKKASEFNAVLLAMAAHDLRQPMQLILGAFSRLGGECPTGREHEYIRLGELAIRRLTEQLDHLVDALRMHERRTIALAPVVLAPLLAAQCREHAEFAQQGGVTLRVCPTRMAVMSDAVLLDGILRNLVRNAIKYTRPGGRILIGCRRRGAEICIEVHDTGIGIAADHLSRVFDAFHRVDSTDPNGLGLGLFVVRRAADVLGHRIDVHSMVGHGSCFSILAQAACPPQAIDLPAEQSATASFLCRPA